jgi:ring-1,2-phenylacetyl-CoA epoxidase subunit PaaD
MVDETSKRQNVETSKGGLSDCQLPNAYCQLDADEIGNRQSTIDNPRIAAIWRALETVTDPEIPVISVVDMGIIADVRVEDRRIAVDMTPTFVGCPALDVIRENIRLAVSALGEHEVEVNVVFDPPWSSDRITEEGRRKLKAFGLAPPVRACAGASLATSLEQVPCPHCDSTHTEVESIFGPTLCRSIHYCRDCLQSFEHFKPV